MGRKKNRRKSPRVQSVVSTSIPKSTPPLPLPSASAKPVSASASAFATYLLCGLMFAIGVLATKTYDRWKERQEFSLRKKTELRGQRATPPSAAKY